VKLVQNKKKLHHKGTKHTKVFLFELCALAVKFGSSLPRSSVERHIFNFKFALVLSFVAVNEAQTQTYSLPWLNDSAERQTIQQLKPPVDFERVPADTNTFADWLRHLPLKIENNIVYLFSGSRKPNQAAHYRVLAIDAGKQDLQQCADAVIRLRAEYLFGQGQPDEIAFNFTSGARAAFKAWRRGYRPRVQGRTVTWKLSAAADSSYQNFREYLNTVFLYAGSASLNLEMKPAAMAQIQIGDVFIKGGFPGHAVIVVDLAVNPNAGKKAILLAQSYMPAQEIHLLKNPQDEEMSPWYVVNGKDKLYTPEWTFEWSALRRF